jgi:4-amino-4-deoxy-L-arabinose transferase-like glycosyltransferase
MSTGVRAPLVAQGAQGAQGAHGNPTDSPVFAPAPIDRRIVIVAGALFVLLMALSGRYGFHRDELYFLDCARHLSAGYVDQPAFSPLLARLSLAAFGASLPALRLWPALSGAGTVVLAGLLAREFGGGRTAQLLGALGAATMPALLGADHLFGPTAFDLLFWTALALVVARIGRTGAVVLWVPAGAILGLGLANKEDIGLFALALVVGMLASGGGHLLANRWFAVGALIAVGCAVPDLWWQWVHHWPTVAMTASLHRQNGGLGAIPTWIVGQLLMATLALAWVWVAGIGFLWRSGRPPWRALVWAYGLLFVLFAVTTGAKVYYLAGAYVYLLAAGSVRAEAWLDARPYRLPRVMALVALGTAVTLPVVLPVLPVRDARWTAGTDKELGETVGWPQLVGSVASAWESLPSGQRRHAVIFTADYGEAGAINTYGPALGLPTAVSGHNSEWFWGPGDPHATTVVAVAPGPEDVTGYNSYLHRFFRAVRVVATLKNRVGLHNQEWDGHIYLCSGLRRPWGDTWASLEHYS